MIESTMKLTQRFTGCASLAALGIKLRSLDLLGPIRKLVQIPQKTVKQMERAMKQLYQQHSQGYRHDYHQQYQILDVDLTGLPCGKKAALARHPATSPGRVIAVDASWAEYWRPAMGKSWSISFLRA